MELYKIFEEKNKSAALGGGEKAIEKQKKAKKPKKATNWSKNLCFWPINVWLNSLVKLTIKRLPEHLFTVSTTSQTLIN